MDAHLVDQIVFFFNLFKGESVITLSEVTEHLRSNVWVIEKFLPARFYINRSLPKGQNQLRVVGSPLPN